MKNYLIDFICAIFNLQRKQPVEYAFYVDYKGLEGLWSENDIVEITDRTRAIAKMCKGFRVYKVTYSVKSVD